jgi:hypothetical protein
LILSITLLRATPLHTFTDYIRGGCQINLMVAIDFTASNGRQDIPQSLHFIGAQRDNEYQQAIRAVASVLAPYDSDQMIPVYGFGARLPPDGHVSHCFPLNFNDSNPEVYGVQGILDVYRYSLGQVQLYGPTNFSSFLDKAIDVAVGTTSQETQSYFILLVITVSLQSTQGQVLYREPFVGNCDCNWTSSTLPFPGGNFTRAFAGLCSVDVLLPYSCHVLGEKA